MLQILNICQMQATFALTIALVFSNFYLQGRRFKSFSGP